MTFHPWTTEFKKSVAKIGLESTSLIYGAPEQLPRFVHDLEALELIYGPPDEILHYWHFRPYQKWMAGMAIKQDGFLGAEMGLGKTAATLYAIVQMIKTGFIKHVLIVAPLKVAEETWSAEIAKWSFARHLKYRIVTGDEAERKASLRHEAQVTIINRENLPWLQKTLGVRGWVFDCLVYDEASRLKSGRKRSKPKARADGTMPPKKLTEFGILRRMRFTFKRVIELSGTPSPNGLIDLWGPIFMIDLGERLGTSMTAYKKRWFREPNRFSQSTKVEPFDHSEREIMSKIDDIFFSLKEEDYITLPPMIPVDHKVKLTEAERKRYKAFEAEMAIDVAQHGHEPEFIEAVNQGVLTGKLLQFANGSLYREDKSSVRIHDHKLDVLESIMEEAMGQPVLVAYSFQFDKDAIKKRFPYVRIYGESKSDMRDWNAGKIRMLLTHPASAGHGLNFQKGSSIAVWYGLTWSLELYRQFIKRLHRSGQKASKVFLHRIITEGTMDETVLTALLARGATQDSITDAVRVRLEQEWEYEMAYKRMAA